MPPRKRKAPLKAIVEAEEADTQEEPAAQEAAPVCAQNEEDEEQIRLVIQEAKEQGACKLSVAARDGEGRALCGDRYQWLPCVRLGLSARCQRGVNACASRAVFNALRHGPNPWGPARARPRRPTFQTG